ncbi:glycosyl transferase, group I [Seminavis robusta]|uniref:Glycosyl transferase, group I n=1 Tax=Seminavis robusta TaxID=568900 RepID=A0A9N8EM48_9STRA|nr:glycosyl transferase, group I [Seminavis robusta]|eukprot:Sro1347_g264960.1 glycosyl transferase, group I (573) ;mRNA; f:27404-29122
MSTLVRRRVSGGTSNELSDPWKGQQASTLLDDSQSYSKGYRLGNSHQRLPMKKRSAGAPTLIIALIVMVGLSTWFAVQHWHVFGSSPKKNWIFSEFTELELLLEDSGKKVHAYDNAFVVFVSISNGESTRVERGSSQVSTVEAFQMALDLHGTKQGVFNDRHWIKVDVVDHVETIENFDVSKKLDEQIHSRGWFHGIALDWESGWTFLPEEVWAQNMIDAQTNKVRWDSIVACVLERKRVGSQDSVDWSSFSKTRDLETSSLPKGLNLFHTSSFFLDASSLSIKSPFGSEVLPLYHGHRLFEKDDITPERLMQAATYAGDYLTRSIQPEDNGKFPRGRMTYQYNPRTDHETDAYNLSCQAGSLFAMSCLLHDHKDANLLHGIRMGLDFIINQNLKECHILEDDQPMVTKCVVENVRDEQGVESHVAKLGPNALTLLAISEFVAASRELGMLSKDQLDRYIGIARGLADYIRSTQHDDGSFIQKIQIWPTVEVDEEFYVRFYQGEAAFAMSRFYFVSGLVGREQDTEWLEVAESAAHFVTATEVEVPDTEFFDDPWLMNGWPNCIVGPPPWYR